MAAKRKTAKPPASAFNSEEAAFLAAAVEDGIRIQPRFRPEPLLARTGRGHMASVGVAEVAAQKPKRRAARK